MCLTYTAAYTLSYCCISMLSSVMQCMQAPAPAHVTHASWLQAGAISALLFFASEQPSADIIIIIITRVSSGFAAQVKQSSLLDFAAGLPRYRPRYHQTNPISRQACTFLRYLD